MSAPEPQPRQFRPRPMRLSILTAALQELTPRARREADPDLAIEEWLQFAREIGSPNIELSAALHPTESDVPAAAMLDPVANTLDLRRPFDAQRAARVRRAMQATRVGLSDLAYFDNMLAPDAAVRQRKHELMLRVFDAAVQLGTDAVTGFVGRNPAARHGRQPRDVRGGVRAAAARRRRRAASPSASSSAPCRAGTSATASTTTSPTRPGRGSRCTASVSSTASANSSASTTTRHTPSSWARTRARYSST